MRMRYLTEAQIRQVQAEVLAQQLADRAEQLQREAKSRGLVIEMESIADSFSIVTVRPRDIHAPERLTAVPA